MFPRSFVVMKNTLKKVGHENNKQNQMTPVCPQKDITEYTILQTLKRELKFLKRQRLFHFLSIS